MSDAIHLEREKWFEAAEVADGFWLIATRHRPGFTRMMPEVNNRCAIFRLEEAGQPLLFVVNGVDSRAMPEVRRIERQTGLEVRYILSPGGGHHLLLPEWRDEFEKATVLVPPARIPKLASATRLMRGGRVSILSIDDPLPQFRGQLDVVVFHGLSGTPDLRTPREGGRDGFFALLKVLRELRHLRTPCDEVWLHHGATDTVVGGENLGWILSKRTIEEFPLLMRPMFEADMVYVNDQSRKVADPEAVAASWQQILAWPCKTLMGLHEPPGEAFVGDGQRALAEAVRRAHQAAGAAPAAGG